MVIQTDGVVLKSSDSGDNDKRISILTRHHGIVTAAVKGAKSLKNRMFHAVQLFSYSNFTITEKGGWHYISNAELTESFIDIRKDVAAISLASYIAELASAFAVVEDCETIMTIVINAFYYLSKNDNSHLTVKPAFELKLAALAGFMPEIEVCAGCCDEFEKGEAIYFNPIKSGMYCSKCANSNSLPLSYDAYLAFRYIVFSSNSRFLLFHLSPVPLSEIAAAAECYILGLADKNFKTLEFYNKMLYKII